MSAATRELVLLAVTLLSALGCAWYYVMAVLDGDRTLSRAAAVAFLLFGVCSVIFLVRLL